MSIRYFVGVPLLVTAAAVILTGCAGKDLTPGSEDFLETRETVRQVANSTHTVVCLVDGWFPAEGIGVEVSTRASAALTQLQTDGTLGMSYTDILLGALAGAQLDDDGETLALIEGSLLGFEGFWLVTFGEPLPVAGDELEAPYDEFTIIVLTEFAVPCVTRLALPPG